MQTPPPTVAPAATISAFVQTIVSAIGGALVTVVAFRTKIALMDRRIESRKSEIFALEEKLTTRLEAINRRQALMLDIVADIARKVGADARFSDAVVRFLAEEASQRPFRDRDDDLGSTGERRVD